MKVTSYLSVIFPTMMFGISCSGAGVVLLVLLVTICAISEAARYRLKFTTFIVLSAIAASCCIPLMFLHPKDWRNALMPAWAARQTAKLLGVNFKVRGQENIVKDTGCVVLINHQSAIDLCVLAELWPVLERCTVVAKRVIFYFGTFGLASWLWGTIFIDRNNVTEAQNTINSTADTINRRKAKLLLFPEGKRYSGNSLMPFKKGAFHVAIRSQTPIQPVVVSKYYFLNDRKKTFRSGTSYITILAPIPTKGLTVDDLPMLMEKSWELMNTKFLETSQEILATEKIESFNSCDRKE